jgi:hypothetical protein
LNIRHSITPSTSPTWTAELADSREQVAEYSYQILDAVPVKTETTISVTQLLEWMNLEKTTDSAMDCGYFKGNAFKCWPLRIIGDERYHDTERAM